MLYSVLGKTNDETGFKAIQYVECRQRHAGQIVTSSAFITSVMAALSFFPLDLYGRDIDYDSFV